MSAIRVAIVGVGNCASALVQGVAHYRRQPQAPGLDFPVLGGYRPVFEVDGVLHYCVERIKVRVYIPQYSVFPIHFRALGSKPV